MRIIAGDKKGRVIEAPGGLNTRPTLDRVREAVFGMIQFELYGASVLDLFAGSGAMGLEALSRGAKSAVFNDSSRQSIAVVRSNIAKLGYGNEAIVMECDYAAAVNRLAALGRKIDIAFLDPPYAAGILEDAIARLAAAGVLSSGFKLIAEHPPENPPGTVDGTEIILTRRYGKAAVTIFGEEST